MLDFGTIHHIDGFKTEEGCISSSMAVEGAWDDNAPENIFTVCVNKDALSKDWLGRTR
jgi:hypothetical protein